MAGINNHPQRPLLYIDRYLCEVSSAQPPETPITDSSPASSQTPARKEAEQKKVCWEWAWKVSTCSKCGDRGGASGADTSPLEVVSGSMRGGWGEEA